MKMIEMEIGTFYFLPYRVPLPFTKEQYFDCMVFDNGRVILIDSESYFISTEDGCKSLRKIMYPYEEN